MEFKADIENDCGHHIIVKKGEFCSPDSVVDKIKTIIPGSSQKEIFAKLKKKYNCDDEVCILEQPDIKAVVGNSVIANTIAEYFKPDGPRNNNNWFSNDDIDNVLEQIEKKYTEKNFKHIEFQMIDFEKTNSKLAQLDWPKEYAAGFRSFGTVFNTDVSTGRGQHWMSVYASFQDEDDVFTIEYFNSSGELPMNQLHTWMKKVKHLWQPFFKKPILDIVSTRIINQFDNWSCGAYALYYIISRLDGVHYTFFKTNHIGDSNMMEFRKYLFRKSK